jgi:hypothetical protein
VIATLRALATTIASDDVTVDGLVHSLGGSAVEKLGNVLVDDPSLEGVAQASVVRDASGQAPAHVTLELLDPVAEEALTASFGAPTPVAPEFPGGPERVLYELDLPDGSYNAALIASIEERGARRVTLRRDPRLR